MKDNTRKKIIKWWWILLVAPFVFVGFWILLVLLFAKIPSFEELENHKSNLATELISCDGRVLSTYHIENRTFATFEDLPQSLIDAAVATEDARFYKHSGIDFRGLARVAVKTLAMRESSSGGGSTITQQLAKTLFPRDEKHLRFPGAKVIHMVNIKFKEWITAVKLERNYTKNEIMTMYMNAVFFGSNAYGINTAARTFFDKTPSELTAEESACLVGMINKPTRYNPALNYDQSLARRNLILGRMKRYGYLTKHECDSLQQLDIKLTYQRQDHTTGLAPYFRDMLRRTMNATKPVRRDYRNYVDYQVDSTAWVDDPLFGWLNKNVKPDGTKYNLDKDGLRIYTTIDSRMQRYAEQAVKEHLSKDLQPAFNRELKYKRNRPFANGIPADVIAHSMEQARRWSDRYTGMKKAGIPEKEILKSFDVPVPMNVFSWNKKGGIDTVMTPNDSILYYKSFLRAAIMAVEPNTGKVKAYVGGPDYRYFKYDNVRQGRRQVGSTIKPYLYTLAMQEGYSPCDRVANIPYTFTDVNPPWTPKSTDRAEYIGRVVTLKWGLTHSSNNISAFLMKQFGPEAMIEMCRKMGISSYLDPVYSLCVGSCDISVFEMVSAYNTYPSRGVYISSIFVDKIEDSQGNLLESFSAHKREALSAQTAYLMVNLMQGVVNEGTAGRIKWKYGLQGAAGKTGTTNDNSDGWFIGYVPRLTAGVWVGCEDRQVHFDSGALGQGANAALPIWGLFMQKVMEDKTIGIHNGEAFVPPAGWDMDLGCTGGGEDLSYGETGSGTGLTGEGSEYFD
ncbi:MAG: transglycosylase domain-containing protein [Bacteroidales bacterium]|nr:transglycosylase domain-containing protein [Bacteroidales bacterium]